MTRLGLTRRMRETLLVIQELAALDGVSPSFREIRHELDISGTGDLVRTVNALQERGYVTRRRARARSILVLQPIAMPEEPEIVGLFDDPVAADLVSMTAPALAARAGTA